MNRFAKLPVCRLSISAITILCASMAIGIALITAVYALPTGPMREHARQAILLYEREGTRPEWSGGGLRKTRHYTRLDNAVEMMMICIATTPREHTPLVSAMLAEKPSEFTTIGENYPISLQESPKTELELKQYARYWHGYLFFLKPMLLFWTPQEIRVFNAFFVLFCFCVACLAAKIRFGMGGFLAFFAATLFMNPVSACLSLQYTAAFAISSLSFSFVCRRVEWLSENHGRIALFFLVVGILIAFFDFLTFPLATWGLPLVALLVAMREKTFGHMAKVGVLSAFWLVGYAGMWASKWVAVSILAGINVVQDAAEQVSYRMTGTTWAGEIDGPRALAENWHVFNGTPVIPIAILSFVAIMAVLRFKHQRMDWRRWPSGLGLLSIAIVPVIWVLVLRNHSFVHAYMVSKMFAVSALAILAIPVSVHDPADRPQSREPLP